MWLQEMMWQYSEAYQHDLFKCKPTYSSELSGFSGRSLKERQHFPLSELECGWPWLSENEGTKDTWRMTPASRKRHGTRPWKNLMGTESLWLYRFSASVSPPWLVLAHPWPPSWLRYSWILVPNPNVLCISKSDLPCLYSRTACQPCHSARLHWLFLTQPLLRHEHHTRHLGMAVGEEYHGAHSLTVQCVVLKADADKKSWAMTQNCVHTWKMPLVFKGLLYHNMEIQWLSKRQEKQTNKQKKPWNFRKKK